MKKLVLVIVVIGLMICGGWLVLNVSSNSASFGLRTDRIKEDTSKAIDKVKQVGRKIEDSSDAPVNDAPIEVEK